MRRNTRVRYCALRGLVTSIRLHFLDVLLHLKHRGPNIIPCDVSFLKGEGMGWFQHGSIVIVFAPHGFKLCENVKGGNVIRTGQLLLRLPEQRPSP
jgi:phosphatidylserine decarboxylase